MIPRLRSNFPLFEAAVIASLFGIGWALAGACPGPLFAMIGNGAVVMSVSLASALVGTWVYGVLRSRLPH